MIRAPLPRAVASAGLATRTVAASAVAMMILAVVLIGSAANAAPVTSAAAKSAAASASASSAAKSAAVKSYAVKVGRSPSVPNPNPPLGGLAPDGTSVGGSALRQRGFILPRTAPALPKQLTASAWMVTDLDTGAVLAARDPHGRYQPASVLKLLAGLVMLPNLPGARVVTATAAAANAEGSAVGLVPGGHYTVDTLFKSLYLMSGNDAAMALSLANGGPARTVAEMNAYARRLGAYDTVVQTPSGLDGWTQLTSAYDLTLILRAAVNTPRLLAYDEARTARLPAQKVGKRKWGGVPLFNESDNFFATVPGALLAKTGFTGAAQHTYACAAVRGGRRIGVVFLRNQRRPLDQYKQAGALLNWAFALPRTTTPVGHLGVAESASAPKARVTANATDGATAAPTSRASVTTPTSSRHPTQGRKYGPLYAVVAMLAAASFIIRAYGRRRRRDRRGH